MKTIAEILRNEAAECRDSAENNGAYNDIFTGVAIVLESLASKFEENEEHRPTTDNP